MNALRPITRSRKPARSFRNRYWCKDRLPAAKAIAAPAADRAGTAARPPSGWRRQAAIAVRSHAAATRPFRRPATPSPCWRRLIRLPMPSASLVPRRSCLILRTEARVSHHQEHREERDDGDLAERQEPGETHRVHRRQMQMVAEKQRDRDIRPGRKVRAPAKP